MTGNSYGGGESWTQASQARWTFPHEESDGELPILDLQVAVPKYGWTDLLYSLAPTGHANPAGEAGPGKEPEGIYESSARPADDDTPDALHLPDGVPKPSYINFFYLLGNTDGVFESKPPAYTPPCSPDRPEDPYSVHAWYGRIQAGEPYEGPIVNQIRCGLTEYRSSYYQQQGWAAQRDGRKVAIFGIQGGPTTSSLRWSRSASSST